MGRYGLRASKPHAVLVAVLSTAMVIYGIVQFVRNGEFELFHVAWVAIGGFIAVAALRQGFGSRPGRGTTVVADDSDGRPRGSMHLWGMSARPDGPQGRYALRPGRIGAVVSAVIAAGMLVFGVLMIDGPFLVLWVLFIVALTGFNLWSAFAPRGATSVLERRDG